MSLLEHNRALNVMLLERCEPGMHLTALAEEQQDFVIAGLLQRIWRKPTAPHTFRLLSKMVISWSSQAREKLEEFGDRGVAEEGLNVFEELLHSSPAEVLLAGDLQRLARSILKPHITC